VRWPQSNTRGLLASVAVARMASLLGRKRRATDSSTDAPGGALRRQWAVALEVLPAPCAQAADQLARRWLPRGKAA
jgi:hypothetical protein